MSPFNEFFPGKLYLFMWSNGNEVLRPVIGEPASIEEEKILFHFFYDGHKSATQYVKKDEILAVFDNTEGMVEVVGWTGKFAVLNRNLFINCVQEGVIKVKKPQ